MTAATADSRYASGASENLVVICTPARALAESAKIPYTNSRTRPRPVPSAASRGRAGDDGSATGHRRDLLQPQHQDGDHQAGDAEDEVAPPRRLHAGQQERGRRERDHRDQVADEGSGLA